MKIMEKGFIFEARKIGTIVKPIGLTSVMLK
jgi:hypothetical protein